VIVLVLFLADLILGLSGLNHLAPFKYANPILDLVFIICAAVLAYFSWFTMKEQV
jgi:TRAP-type C4-dicarboxylate transport system permease small subunit